MAKKVIKDQKLVYGIGRWLYCRCERGPSGTVRDGKLDPRCVFNHPELLFDGAAGCLAGESELWDPIAKVGRRIDQLCLDGVRPWVQTLAGPVLAEVPFVKGFTSLYRVTMEDGRSCLATADHKFLARSGWVHLASLSVGDELLVGHEQDTSHRSKSHASDPRWTQTASNSPAGCRTSPRSHGQRLPFEEAAARVWSPSQCDALARIRDDWRPDDLASRQASNLTCPACGRPSTGGFSRGDAAAPLDASRWGAHTTLAVGCCDASSTHERAFLSSQQLGRSRQGSRLILPSEPQWNDFGNRPTDGHDVRLSPSEKSRVQWGHIKEITHERDDFYFDLHVPVQEHYLADGMWSHNTGKTFQDCLRTHIFCEKYPGVRVLWLRETMKSLRDSVLPIYERFVLFAPNEFVKQHPVLAKGGTSENRSRYTYPNGSYIQIGGTDRPDLYLSSEWDLVIVFEATNHRIREHTWSTIATRMRGTAIPHPHCQFPDGWMKDERTGKNRKVVDMLIETDRFAERIAADGRTKIDVGCDDYGCPLFFRQRTAECNPSIMDGENHWLMKRWKSGNMVRLVARHIDNPKIDGSYLEELRALPEPYRSVYLEGKWIAAEGKCWPTFNPRVHMVRGEFEAHPDSGRAYVRVLDWRDDTGQPKVFPVRSVVAGFDWGVDHPASLQIFAVTHGEGADRKAFRIAEVLQIESLDWWAKKVVELKAKYGIQAILCDPSARGIWEHFNMVLGPRGGHDASGICQGAVNTHGTEDWVLGGIDLVRTMFLQNRLFLFEDCHEGPIDAKLRMKNRAIGLHEEIPGYVLAKDKDGNTLQRADKSPNAMDDACDAARYALMDIFSSDRNLKPKPMDTKTRFDPYVMPDSALENKLARMQELMNTPVKKRY